MKNFSYKKISLRNDDPFSMNFSHTKTSHNSTVLPNKFCILNMNIPPNVIAHILLNKSNIRMSFLYIIRVYIRFLSAKVNLNK